MGGVGAGGGAGLYKARTGPGAPNPPDTGIAEARAGAEYLAGGVYPRVRRGRCSRVGMDNAQVQSLRKLEKKNQLGGGDKMRLPNESKAAGRP